MQDHIATKRIKLEAKDGRFLYYDIDADDKVYWLRIRSDNHIQRYRVFDDKLSNQIRGVASGAS